MKNLKTYESFSTLLILAMIASLLLFLRGLFKDLKKRPSKFFSVLGDVSHLMKNGEIDPTLNHFKDRYTIDIIFGEDKTNLFIRFNEDETELYFNIQYPSGNRTEIEVDLENQTFVFNSQEYKISDRTLRNIKKQISSIKKQF